jgi:hypothetical protein
MDWLGEKDYLGYVGNIEEKLNNQTRGLGRRTIVFYWTILTERAKSISYVSHIITAL